MFGNQPILTNLDDAAYESYRRELKNKFRGLMADYFVARKTNVEAIMRKDKEDVKQSWEDMECYLFDMAKIAMFLLAPHLFLKIDRKIFELSPRASKYKYDENGDVWLLGLGGSPDPTNVPRVSLNDYNSTGHVVTEKEDE